MLFLIHICKYRKTACPPGHLLAWYTSKYWERVIGLDFNKGLHLASVRDQFQQAFYEEEQGEERVHDMEDIG